MRLLDQLIRSAPTVAVADAEGKLHRLTGVGAKRHSLETCSLRYVLDKSASSECFNLLHSAPEFLDSTNHFLRMPAQSFWIEWFSEVEWLDARQDADISDLRLGALVECGQSCRNGQVTAYWRNRQGAADLVVVTTEFDLDAELSAPSNFPSIPFGPGCGHLHSLMRHMAIRMDTSWGNYLRAARGDFFREDLARLKQATALYFPFILAFSALLTKSDALAKRPSDLGRINRARVRRGRLPLLDHIEVTLKIGPSADAHGTGSNGGGRVSPRLHFVRGHVVRRSGKIFWRSPHLRGSPDHPVATKTVRVSSRREVAA